MNVEDYDVREEATCIDAAILLRHDPLKAYLVTPILAIVTLFSWPIILYWSVERQRDRLYKKAHSIADATHVYIRGRDGN